MAQKFSLQWLREWVDLGLDYKKLAARLDMAGIEVGGISPVAGDFTGVVVGYIQEAKQHPDADRLRVCQVTIAPESFPSPLAGEGGPSLSNSPLPLAGEGARRAGEGHSRMGGDNPLTIVCGAPNARTGLKVALERVGGSLPNGMVLKEVK